MSATSIGIRELRDTLSATLQRVRAGEVVTVTDRDEPVALIVPFAQASLAARLEALHAAGIVSHGGRKPLGSANPPKIEGTPVSDYLAEDRR